MNPPSAVSIFAATVFGVVVAGLILLALAAICACLLGAWREKRLVARCRVQAECTGCRERDEQIEALRVLAREATQVALNEKARVEQLQIMQADEEFWRATPEAGSVPATREATDGRNG